MFYAKRGGRSLFRPVIPTAPKAVENGKEEKVEDKTEEKPREPKPNKRISRKAPVNNTVETQNENEEGNKLEQD